MGVYCSDKLGSWSEQTAAQIESMQYTKNANSMQIRGSMLQNQIASQINEMLLFADYMSRLLANEAPTVGD